MCLGQTVGNLRCDGDSPAKREWTRSQQLTQRLTANQLHSDVGCAVHVSKFVNGNNARVVQRRGSFRFALETAEGLRVMRYIVGQEL